VANADGCLIDEPSVERLYAEELGERVIQGKEPVLSRGWEIGLPGCVHMNLFLPTAPDK
jgi:hypothetical protein